MKITLVPVEDDRFVAWMSRCESEYTEDLIAGGESAETAARHAADSLQRAFPNETATADNVVFDLVHDTDGVVGYLWIGRDQTGGEASWWIWDVVVESAHRGKGYGREAMRLAESYARAQGARSLGLSVFGHNIAARRLYEASGYTVTTVKMRKVL